LIGISKQRIPLWLKIAWTAWLAVWAPVYWRQYGAQNFLYFCDLGNFLIAVGLWLESRRILSWQAVGLLAFQTIYVLDLLGAYLFRRHFIGGTEYMFDPGIALWIRLLGLYHAAVPILLLWLIRHLGYDRSAWKWQVLTTCAVVPINYFWRPQFNVNWARGIGHQQHVIPGWLYLAGYLAVTTFLIYLPTHWALTRWSAWSKPVPGQSPISFVRK